jgi:predicted RNase H-like HicB family nuclease
MPIKFTVVLERGIDGYHVARCPLLKGCWTQGRTQAEATANMKEAIRLYLDGGAKKFKPASGQKVFSLSV